MVGQSYIHAYDNDPTLLTAAGEGSWIATGIFLNSPVAGDDLGSNDLGAPNFASSVTNYTASVVPPRDLAIIKADTRDLDYASQTCSNCGCRKHRCRRCSQADNGIQNGHSPKVVQVRESSFRRKNDYYDHGTTASGLHAGWHHLQHVGMPGPSAATVHSALVRGPSACVLMSNLVFWVRFRKRINDRSKQER